MSKLLVINYFKLNKVRLKSIVESDSARALRKNMTIFYFLKVLRLCNNASTNNMNDLVFSAKLISSDSSKSQQIM